MNTYIATNTLNGKFYIGSSKNFEQRKKEHLAGKENYPFQNALRKNSEIFEWEVTSDDSDEPILEQALLEMFFGTEQCYNLNPIAGRPPNAAGKTRSEETRQRMREAMLGKTPSEETRKKISRGMSGKTLSEETKQKIREAMYGNKPPNSKAVLAIKPDGIELYFCSISEAAKEIGIHPNQLGRHLKLGKSPKKGKFKDWRFVYENQ